MEVRLEDRLQHQLQDACTTRSETVGDPQPPQPAVRLGNHPLPDRQRAEAAVRNEIRSDRGSPRHPATPRSRRRWRRPLRRCVAPCSPDPSPCNQQERRIDDEVEQIIEPAMRIIAGPTVQLGLISRTRRSARYRAAPPVRRYSPATTSGHSSSSLPTCWPPSPCGRLSRPRSTNRVGEGTHCRAPPPSEWAGGLSRPSSSKPRRVCGR